MLEFKKTNSYLQKGFYLFPQQFFIGDFKMKKVRFFSLAVAVVMVLFISVWAATGSQKVNLGASIGVAGVPVGQRICSNELAYYFGTVPTNATVTSHAYSLGTISANTGTFTIDTLKIRCNYPTPPNETKIPWIGSGTLTTTFFSGQPAKTTCYVAFCGKCISGYSVAGQPVNQCNKSYTNSNMTVYYIY